MKAIVKNLNSIAYLFASLILFQSCVAYQYGSSSIKEATQNDQGRIKIKTNYGKEYIFWWIEEKDDNIVSVLNTKKTSLLTKNISYIKTTGSSPILLPLESLTAYKGEVIVTALDKKGKLHEHKFVNIVAQDNLLQGLEMIKMDTIPITIPKDQIESIKLENKSASNAGNFLIGLVVIVGVFSIIGLIDIQKNGLPLGVP